jgi:predicted nuclease of restriction endonuclease-like (RecB) superfamily
MTSPTVPSKQSTSYASLLIEIRQRIGHAQTKAILAVNSELIQLYWSIGQLIDERQKIEGWGAGVIPQLAQDIRNEAPELKGFSERNIKRMLAFYREHSTLSFVPQAVAQMDKPSKVTQAMALLDETAVLQISWGHHLTLMEAVKDRHHRLWYMKACTEHGWSRSVLLAQIQTQAHTRQGALVSNFARTLPAAQSDLVQQAFKDPYIFDFLTLTDTFTERELEVGLVKHLEQFLIELGRGFAFVGRQYHLDIGERDFYIDLLFYHLELRCFVVIELKRGEFKPEYAGKMNFYCSAVDDTLKKPNDAPTIG